MEQVLVIQPYLALLKDIITIASLITAGIVAIKGLRTWRHQLRGTADYELAKRILKATYRLRDALQTVRNPLIPAGEIDSAIKEMQIDIKSPEERFGKAVIGAVYQQRWKYVQECYQALEVEALEAETLWGPGAREAILAIRENVNSLLAALHLYLRDEMQPHGHRILDDAGRESVERIVFSMSSNPAEDKYLGKLEAAIGQIEKIVRPRLIR